MTKIEAKKKLKQASDLIFEVESQLPLGEFPRQYGYQARIKLGSFEDAIKNAHEFPGVVLNVDKYNNSDIFLL